MTVRSLPEALAEARAAARYYNQQRRGLGKEFRDAVNHAVEEIRSFPEGWQAIEGGLRRHRVKRFPFGIVYQLTDDEIIVVAITDLRRDQSYWLRRL
jgi:mRNA-degrading endonuclease RelE of RelBE toxin-antitoxin system